MPKIKTLKPALDLFTVYVNEGWDAFLKHQEASTDMENILTLAVANKKTDFALKILETTPQLSDSGRPIFTACCQTQQWDVAYAVVNKMSKSNWLIQRYMASEALNYKNVDLMEHILNHAESKSEVVYILLQDCAKEKHLNRKVFEKLLSYLPTPLHQEDLCELFLWESPDCAKIMLQTIPELFNKMASHDLVDQGRRNFEIFYAEQQKEMLNSTVFSTNAEKNDAHIKKI